MKAIDKINRQVEAIENEKLTEFGLCNGQRWNLNRYILLLENVDKRKLRSKINDALLEYFVVREQRITEAYDKPQILGQGLKGEFKSLNVIFRTKNEVTKKKRVLKMIHRRMNTMWNGMMLYHNVKNADEVITTIFDYVDVDWKL